MIRSTRIRTVSFLTVALLATTPSLAKAQNETPRDSTAADTSLAERLERAERALERLQRQMEEQNQAKVSSRLRNRVELSGMVLANGFSNNARVNNTDNPQFVLSPQDTTGLPNAAAGGTVRQSRIGLSVSGSRALGAMLSADLQLDFYGGQQPSAGGRTFPLPRIRTAFARLDWAHVGLLIGQETQVISPHTPSSFAAVGIPEFTDAGNLWFWLPQARLTAEIGTSPRVGLQWAAMAPNLGTAQTSFTTVADSAEKSQRPFVQSRVYIGWGDGDAESQIGFGVHYGWIATSGDSLLTSEALTADLRLALGEKVLLLAEGFYNGQALAGLGGGGIAQSFGLNGVPVNTRGGWVQLNLRPTFAWELGGGYGMDDPDDTDLPATGRLKNVIIEGHLHWKPGGGLTIGAAFRRLTTTYATGDLSANVINLFSGVSF